jgi:TolB-like protein/class 3 adenylate cyclase/Tfp pilus assembly protein PilF
MEVIRAERRLVAIMAADIVGYSRLIGADEAGTLVAIKDLRREVIDPLLTEHRGRIVKLMGDGALVEFGSVVDAVACAVAVQNGVAARQAGVPTERRIVFRIGINLGDVVVDGEDLLGDGVNVAARLEQICEPGGVLVSGTAFDHLKGKLDLPLEFIGEQRLKNIAEPVRAYGVRLDGTRRTWRFRAKQPLGRTTLVAAGLITLLLLGGGLWWFWPVEPASAKPAIAVLPFNSYGSDEATGRLADGITEDIIIDLARFRNFDVIARNSTAIYKGKPVDVRQVGRELNVSYVLEGSIQRQGDRIRATAQLIDASTGAHVWSNRWDRPVENIFAVQSEVAETVAAKLGSAFGLGTITTAELRRAKRQSPSNLTAYEHYLLAVEAKSQLNPESGLAHAERAIALDPNLARAYTSRGWLRYFMIGQGADYANTLDLVGEDFRRAVALDPVDAEAHTALGVYLQEKGLLAEAEVELHRALDQSPANAHVLAVAANVLPYLGKPEEAVFLADRALRLDPHMVPATLAPLKDAYFFAGRFERAIDIIRAVPEASHERWNRLFLALSYAMLGQAHEAAAAKAKLIANHGERSVEQWLNEGAVFARPAEKELFVDAFRKLDLPLCATDEYLSKIVDPKRLPECVKA